MLLALGDSGYINDVRLQQVADGDVRKEPLAVALTDGKQSWAI